MSERSVTFDASVSEQQRCGFCFNQLSETYVNEAEGLVFLKDFHIDELEESSLEEKIYKLILEYQVLKHPSHQHLFHIGCFETRENNRRCRLCADGREIEHLAISRNEIIPLTKYGMKQSIGKIVECQRYIFSDQLWERTEDGMITMREIQKNLDYSYYDSSFEDFCLQFVAKTASDMYFNVMNPKVVHEEIKMAVNKFSEAKQEHKVVNDSINRIWRKFVTEITPFIKLLGYEINRENRRSFNRATCNLHEDMHEDNLLKKIPVEQQEGSQAESEEGEGERRT